MADIFDIGLKCLLYAWYLLLSYRNVECLEMMIHEGCDVNAVDGTGRYSTFSLPVLMFVLYIACNISCTYIHVL